MNSTLDPGSSLYFRLTIDGHDMGVFNGCEGLAVEVEVEEYSEGGNNGYVTRLPTRLKHSTLKLTRPLTPDSGKLTTWISSIITGVVRPTVQVAALRADGSQVAQWGCSRRCRRVGPGPPSTPQARR